MKTKRKLIYLEPFSQIINYTNYTINITKSYELLHIIIYISAVIVGVYFLPCLNTTQHSADMLPTVNDSNNNYIILEI